MVERVLHPAEPGHPNGVALREEALDLGAVALVSWPDADPRNAQAASARSTIDSASTDGGSMP